MDIKERILSRSSALFLQNGIKSVSMDDIATDLGISKKTLYKWFANKDELVYAVVDSRLCETQSQCIAVSAPALDAIDEMLRLSRWADEQFTGIHPSIFHDMRKFYPTAWQVFKGHKNTFILQRIEDNLRRGVAEGLFHPDLDVEVLARYNLAHIDLVFDTELFPANRFSPQRVNHVLDEHFLLGIVTPRGLQRMQEYRANPSA
jgi:AcrR family transcriptional regulator